MRADLLFECLHVDLLTAKAHQQNAEDVWTLPGAGKTERGPRSDRLRLGAAMLMRNTRNLLACCDLLRCSVCAVNRGKDQNLVPHAKCPIFTPESRQRSHCVFSHS